MGTKVKMLSSMSLRNSFLEVAKTVRSAAGGGPVSDNVVTVAGSLAIFKSKIGVSSNSSSDGSGVGNRIGHSSSSSAVNACIEAVVGGGSPAMMDSVSKPTNV
uniref:Uncharacterized protein n=1 Tax=Romanomermis culicivorax TaxID=13658 RepID=A0A915L1X1_ROMCU